MRLPFAAEEVAVAIDEAGAFLLGRAVEDNIGGVLALFEPTTEAVAAAPAECGRFCSASSSGMNSSSSSSSSTCFLFFAFPVLSNLPAVDPAAAPPFKKAGRLPLSSAAEADELILEAEAVEADDARGCEAGEGDMLRVLPGVGTLLESEMPCMMLLLDAVDAVREGE